MDAFMPCKELPYFAYDEGHGAWREVKDRSGAEILPKGCGRTFSLGDKVSIVQYNIWFGRHERVLRMQAIIDEIRACEADLACLEEMKPSMLDQFLDSPYIRQHFYVTDVTGDTLGSYGVMQLSRIPYVRLSLNGMVTRLGRKALMGEFRFTNTACHAGCMENGEVECRFIQHHAEEASPARRLQMSAGSEGTGTGTGSDLECYSGDDDDEVVEESVHEQRPARRDTLALITAHLESYPQDVAYRRAQILRIEDLLKPFEHAIFCADFNFAEEGEDAILSDQLQDCWKVLHGNEPGFTFDSEANPLVREIKRQTRIDRILVRSPAWVPTHCQMRGTRPFSQTHPELLPSDHFGLHAVLSPSEWASSSALV